MARRLWRMTFWFGLLCADAAGCRGVLAKWGRNRVLGSAIDHCQLISGNFQSCWPGKRTGL